MGLHDEQISYYVCPISYLPSCLLHIKRDYRLKVSLVQTYYHDICRLTYKKYIYICWLNHQCIKIQCSNSFYVPCCNDQFGWRGEGSRIESVENCPLSVQTDHKIPQTRCHILQLIMFCNKQKKFFGLLLQSIL